MSFVHCPFIEPFEPRRLLSVSLGGTTLSITGTTGDDEVIVKRKDDVKLIVYIGDKKKKFDFEAVKRLRIELRDGDDTLDLTRAYVRSEQVDGDDGDDSIIGSSRPDSVEGGDGDDDVTANEGDDTLEGGNGRDELYGSGGNDSIIGGNDRDWLYGQAGNDFLDGNDDLWEDNLYGDAGLDSAHIDSGEAIEDDTSSIEDVDD